MAAALALLVALAFALPPTPSARKVPSSALIDVTLCPDEKQSRTSVCVAAIFVNGSIGDASIECKAFPHIRERTRAPSWVDFVSSDIGRRAASQTLKCDTSALCEIFIQKGLVVDKRYDVFCMDWSTKPPFSTILPECSGASSTSCGVQVRTDHTRVDYHDLFGAVDLICVLMLISYICWSFVFERVRVLHETGMAMLVGFAFGAVIRFGFGKIIRFSYTSFSYVLLPMVIFAAGYNLQARSFFRHVGYVLALGVLCTVLIFLILYFLPQSLEFHTAAGFHLNFSTPRGAHHRLIMASVLSSTDVVAPIAFLPMTLFPNLNAVVFGESILNDVVSILLSLSASTSASVPTLTSLVLDILYYMITSGMMGISFGLSTSYIFKTVQVLHRETLKPCFLLLLINYACYIVAEMCDISSIFALFVCALVSAHYARHSLSHEARQLTKELAEFMAYGAEAFVFGYFGLTSVSYLAEPEFFSLPLILFYTVGILVARFLAVGGMALSLSLAQRLFKGTRPQCSLLSVRELCVVAVAGCMRGTIAYALVLRAMPPEERQTRQERVLVSTVLGVVLINCLVFGTLFPVVLRCAGLKPQLAHEADGEVSKGSDERFGLHRMWHDFDAQWMKPVFSSAGHVPKANGHKGHRLTLVECLGTAPASTGAGSVIDTA